MLFFDSYSVFSIIHYNSSFFYQIYPPFCYVIISLDIFNKYI